MNIGDKIKKMRELKNYTQQHMADEMDLSLSGYGKIERNETDISISRLGKIAKVLDTDVSSILIFDHRNIINVTENKQANISLGGQNINQLEMMEMIIAIYKQEIELLKEIIKDLTARK